MELNEFDYEPDDLEIESIEKKLNDDEKEENNKKNDDFEIENEYKFENEQDLKDIKDNEEDSIEKLINK